MVLNWSTNSGFTTSKTVVNLCTQPASVLNALCEWVTRINIPVLQGGCRAAWLIHWRIYWQLPPDLRCLEPMAGQHVTCPQLHGCWHCCRSCSPSPSIHNIHTSIGMIVPVLFPCTASRVPHSAMFACCLVPAHVWSLPSCSFCMCLERTVASSIGSRAIGTACSWLAQDELPSPLPMM